MEKPFICDSAITFEWEGLIYFSPKNDENNLLAARFNVGNPEYPPLFEAGKELDGCLGLLNITFVGQPDTASPSRIKQEDDSIDEHNTEVTGIVVDINPKVHEARVRVEGFPVDIIVFDECVKHMDVGAYVMFIGDLQFYYES